MLSERALDTGGYKCQDSSCLPDPQECSTLVDDHACAAPRAAYKAPGALAGPATEHQLKETKLGQSGPMEEVPVAACGAQSNTLNSPSIMSEGLLLSSTSPSSTYTIAPAFARGSSNHSTCSTCTTLTSSNTPTSSAFHPDPKLAGDADATDAPFLLPEGAGGRGGSPPLPTMLSADSELLKVGEVSRQSNVQLGAAATAAAAAQCARADGSGDASPGAPAQQRKCPALGAAPPLAAANSWEQEPAQAGALLQPELQGALKGAGAQKGTRSERNQSSGRTEQLAPPGTHQQEQLPPQAPLPEQACDPLAQPQPLPLAQQPQAPPLQEQPPLQQQAGGRAGPPPPLPPTLRAKRLQSRMGLGSDAASSAAAVPAASLVLSLQVEECSDLGGVAPLPPQPLLPPASSTPCRQVHSIGGTLRHAGAGSSLPISQPAPSAATAAATLARPVASSDPTSLAVAAAAAAAAALLPSSASSCSAAACANAGAGPSHPSRMGGDFQLSAPTVDGSSSARPHPARANSRAQGLLLREERAGSATAGADAHTDDSSWLGEGGGGMSLRRAAFPAWSACTPAAVSFASMPTTPAGKSAAGGSGAVAAASAAWKAGGHIVPGPMPEALHQRLWHLRQCQMQPLGRGMAGGRGGTEAGLVRSSFEAGLGTGATARAAPSSSGLASPLPPASPIDSIWSMPDLFMRSFSARSSCTVASGGGGGGGGGGCGGGVHDSPHPPSASEHSSREGWILPPASPPLMMPSSTAHAMPGSSSTAAHAARDTTDGQGTLPAGGGDSSSSSSNSSSSASDSSSGGCLQAADAHPRLPQPAPTGLWQGLSAPASTMGAVSHMHTAVAPCLTPKFSSQQQQQQQQQQVGGGGGGGVHAGGALTHKGRGRPSQAEALAAAHVLLGSMNPGLLPVPLQQQLGGGCGGAGALSDAAGQDASGQDASGPAVQGAQQLPELLQSIQQALNMVQEWGEVRGAGSNSSSSCHHHGHAAGAAAEGAGEALEAGTSDGSAAAGGGEGRRQPADALVQALAAAIVGTPQGAAAPGAEAAAAARAAEGLAPDVLAAALAGPPRLPHASGAGLQTDKVWAGQALLEAQQQQQIQLEAQQQQQIQLEAQQQQQIQLEAQQQQIQLEAQLWQQQQQQQQQQEQCLWRQQQQRRRLWSSPLPSPRLQQRSRVVNDHPYMHQPMASPLTHAHTYHALPSPHTTPHRLSTTHQPHCMPASDPAAPPLCYLPPPTTTSAAAATHHLPTLHDTGASAMEPPMLPPCSTDAFAMPDMLHSPCRSACSSSTLPSPSSCSSRIRPLPLKQQGAGYLDHPALVSKEYATSHHSGDLSTFAAHPTLPMFKRSSLPVALERTLHSGTAVWGDSPAPPLHPHQQQHQQHQQQQQQAVAAGPAPGDNAPAAAGYAVRLALGQPAAADNPTGLFLDTTLGRLQQLLRAHHTSAPDPPNPTCRAAQTGHSSTPSTPSGLGPAAAAAAAPALWRGSAAPATPALPRKPLSPKVHSPKPPAPPAVAPFAHAHLPQPHHPLSFHASHALGGGGPLAGGLPHQPLLLPPPRQVCLPFEKSVTVGVVSVRHAGPPPPPASPPPVPAPAAAAPAAGAKEGGSGTARGAAAQVPVK